MRGATLLDADGHPEELISIHAPVKGATKIRRDAKGVNYFNPRSREGSDPGSCTRAARRTYFNPRSREGSDTRVTIKRMVPSDFNPRSREGSDLDLLRASGSNPISIHAPVKGATPYPAGPALPLEFQSTLP